VNTPTPRFHLGQMVKAVAFVDCFNFYRAETPNLIVTDMKLTTGVGISPYWRVKAESLTDHGYVEGAERYFAPQVTV
jgi:hypothetical protein